MKIRDPCCSTDEGCITCGDVAEEMRVVRIDAERELAVCVDGAGDRHTIEIALVQPVAESDLLLVHVGTAIANLGSPKAPPPPDAEADQAGPSRRRGQSIWGEAEEAAG